MNITKVCALEILDSRGNPTIKTYVELDKDDVASASVPSGASTGKYEAVELRDNDPKRYHGKGVINAINNVNRTINNDLKGISIEKLDEIDENLIDLDGTENKHRLGANAILAVSLAVSRALSLYQKKPLWKTLNEYYFASIKPSFPRLMVNIINGGKHAHWNFDIQEFMIVPKINTPSEAVRTASEFFHLLGERLQKENQSILVGDEGGYSPRFPTDETACNYLAENNNGDSALDIAASELYRNGIYGFQHAGEKRTSQELHNYYLDLIQKYSIISIEDPFAEDDWNAFAIFTQQVGGKVMIVGDDLYATHPARIKKGIEMKATNAVLIKPNQIGTVFETVQAIRMTKDARLKTIISHRSGETEDSFISDLAVACGAAFLKAGSMSRSERLVKYNRLIEIEKREFV